jgi:hypothetical protein
LNQIQSDRPATSTRVFPALIQIEAGQEIPPAQAGKRRITVLLDHTVAKQLAAFSWALAIFGLATRQRVTAVAAGIAIAAGLAIGIINAIRWLFRRS